MQQHLHPSPGGLVSARCCNVQVQAMATLFNQDTKCFCRQTVTADVSITGGTDVGNYTSNALGIHCSKHHFEALYHLAITADNKPDDGNDNATTLASIAQVVCITVML